MGPAEIPTCPRCGRTLRHGSILVRPDQSTDRGECKRHGWVDVRYVGGSPTGERGAVAEWEGA